MADMLQIERWHRPWEPADDARLVEEFDYHDRPLIGMVEQHGVKYLFRCIAGHIEPHHVWVYRSLTDAEAAQLREATEPERFTTLVNDLLSQEPLVLAVADDEDGIWGSTIIDAFTEDDLRAGYERVIQDFQDYLATKRQEAIDSHPLSTSTAP